MPASPTPADAASAPVPPTRIGYVVIESDRRDRWLAFGRDAFGLHADEVEGGVVAFRMDDRQRRLIVRPGPAEDVVSLGWEVEDEAELSRLLSHLSASGVRAAAGGSDEAALRGVEAFHRFDGPKGLGMEVFAGPRRSNAPLHLGGEGFVTGAAGLGHVALVTRKPEAVVADLQRLLGARLSDTITDKLGGIEMEFSFLHMNPRHHSVAVGATKGLRLDPLRTRIQHLALEAATLEDVTAAYERTKALGFRIAMSMGQHPNDEEISFYAVTPSGFEMELGWNPRTIPDHGWEPKTYRGISRWGHQPETPPTFGEKMGQLGAAVGSLFRPA